eukprot:TRINITY_DN842_c0_g1_i4.p1 TRINITY_DN842_c0_g1~~TRINITY_DN842_c0_g1_i4.p1  ORF type:complete len:278 (-),score=42.23 TRINITY_DN842_c0_g1_i4:698-1531(-)
MIFDLQDAPDPNDPGKIKFSFAVFNEGYVWRDNVSAFDTRLLFISYTMNFRFSHSAPQNLFFCKEPSAGAACSSPLANLTSVYNLVTGEQFIQGASNKTRMTLSYPVEGTIDGRPLLFLRNYAVFVGVHPLPLPVYKWLNVYANRGLEPPVSGIDLAEEEQTIAIPIDLSIPKIERSMYYDPDVSIVLLFDPDPDDAAAPVINDLGAGANQTAVIIAVVVVIVVVAAAVLLFAKFVFPYLRARTKGAVELEDEHDRQRSSSAWKRGAAPSSATTIHN